MTGRHLQLEVHGVRVALEGDTEAIERLRLHFAAYAVEERRMASHVHIELLRASPRLEAGPRLRADQVVDRGVVYNLGSVTVVDHHGHAVSRYDFRTERGEVRSDATEDLVEVGYLMVHSRVGVLLEQRGLVRLHCLAVARGGRAAVVLSPSGGGKSTLARAVLRHTDLALLGDDMVLVDRRGQVLPFHSPLGVTDPSQAAGLGEPVAFPRRHHPPKWILPLEAVDTRLAQGPHRPALLALGVRVSTRPSRLAPVPRGRAAPALWRDMVVGLGLPQVLELLARRGGRDLPRLAPSALRRVRAATRLLAQARCAEVELGDPAEAAGLLARALR
ncbi:MAG: hypothetical protein ACOCV4_00170 [Myxococcota bacterium]